MRTSGTDLVHFEVENALWERILLDTNVFRLSLALVGLVAFIALLVATVILAKAGQPMWAAFTGTGAVVVCVGALYRLLLTLGQPA
ncbi:hypothetical protein DEIGR_500001 [Deinococcus grandis]|uniref:Uncharacterized protein n=1 Tax=Deinococcus grandis TaxID=57498 RepID=A0A100HNL3_9DEIO|nr:hypothetical protein DEGR_39760 [Deinococcus grandis]GAQ24008.1 hypothetical protein DEIGR_500001 [Deinococcus grandis]